MPKRCRTEFAALKGVACRADGFDLGVRYCVVMLGHFVAACSQDLTVQNNYTTNWRERDGSEPFSTATRIASRMYNSSSPRIDAIIIIWRSLIQPFVNFSDSIRAGGLIAIIDPNWCNQERWAFFVKSDIRAVILIAHRITDADFGARDGDVDLMSLPDSGRRSRNGGFKCGLLVGVSIGDGSIVQDASFVALGNDRIFGQTHVCSPLLPLQRLAGAKVAARGVQTLFCGR